LKSIVLSNMQFSTSFPLEQRPPINALPHPKFVAPDASVFDFG